VLPELRLLSLSHGVDLNALKSAITDICGPDGFSMDEMRKVCDFPLVRSRSRYRFPPHVRFIYLGSKEPDHFVIGQRRTPKDPSSGIVHAYYVNYGKGSLADNDVTCWAEYRIKPNRLLVNTVQAETILDSYKQGVEEELRSKSVELSGPGAGDLERRVRTLRNNNVPWAYPDRALLFGVVAVILAGKMNLKEIKFTDSPSSELPTKVFEYTKDKIRSQGLKVEKGMLEIW
jgi:hypothetical protein